MSPSNSKIRNNRTAEQLAAFNDIAKALTSTLELSEVLRLVMQKVSELLKPRNWSLVLQDEKTGKLYFELAVGESSEKLRHLRLEPGEGIAGAVFLSGKPQRVDNVRQEPNFSPRFDQVSEFRTQSLLAVPLISRGCSLGVVELVNGPSDPPFTDDDLETLVGIADFAAIALENARNFHRVQELTITDEHTGLYNARHLQVVLDQELERSRRFNHPLSLLFLDLDRFKEVNDTHGHLAGSALLREVGDLLLSCVRQVDLVFRYGGDEYVLLLIETDELGADETAKRVLKAFRERLFLESQGLAVRVSASLGCGTFPTHGQTALELIRAADGAMYQVKAAGRDGVQMAGAAAKVVDSAI